ncbi:hypothetical protein CYLTODRAFT_415546 [Cylindrobasidium torrendii FP15055 ss-10]|uniref:Uncharacterized protein n=1 Tax=Cylindrobasidium torrendii FP15055 ss-10 TaxID=1314674 RepID=A0A0D7ATG1_9AGAR|nr:hypothetical protein CYLTODRAFT_415546 [Cylindrobasidium torrendii FP15055 ss-10]
MRGNAVTQVQREGGHSASSGAEESWPLVGRMRERQKHAQGCRDCRLAAISIKYYLPYLARMRILAHGQLEYSDVRQLPISSVEDRLNCLAAAWGALLSQAKLNASLTYRNANSEKWGVPTLIGRLIDARNNLDAAARSLATAKHEGDQALLLGESLGRVHDALRSKVDAVDYESVRLRIVWLQREPVLAMQLYAVRNVGLSAFDFSRSSHSFGSRRGRHEACSTAAEPPERVASKYNVDYNEEDAPCAICVQNALQAEL